MIWGARKFPQAALMKLMILYTWEGCLRESLEISKESQATCFCMMWIAVCLWSQFKGNWPHRNFILGTLSNFAFLGWHQCTSRLVTVLLGNLWSSIKQIEAPYVFDWENAIALAQCRGIGPHLPGRGKSHGFSRVAAGPWGIFSSYGRDVHSKLKFVKWSQDTCLGMRDISGM